MKKIREFIKSYLAVIFGVLVILNYLDYLAFGGAAIATGIVAIVIGGYCITAGILGVVGKTPAKLQKVLDAVVVASFALFFFVLQLMTVIDGGLVGPSAWTVAIFSMVAALSVVVVYIINMASPSETSKRLAYLFALIFVLALLLSILSGGQGGWASIGDLWDGFSLLAIAMYASYGILLFNSVSKPEAPAPVAIEEKEAEEPVQE